MSKRTEALAERLEQGAHALATFASTLTDAEWQSQTAGRRAQGRRRRPPRGDPCIRWRSSWRRRWRGDKPIEGVTGTRSTRSTPGHAREYDTVTKAAALEHLRRNSTAAAAAIRALTDEQLDRAATVSLNADAPLTCQFFLEDHAVRHSYHHLAAIRKAVKLVQRAA